MYKTRNLFCLLAAMLLVQAQANAVTFKIKNDSYKSIHLLMPGISNHIISPESIKELDLVKGQKVFFNYQGKTYTLFTVTDELDGKSLDINQLIDNRKKQIDQNGF